MPNTTVSAKGVDILIAAAVSSSHVALICGQIGC